MKTLVSKRHALTTSIFLGAAVMLVGFQNCAKTNFAGTTLDSATSIQSTDLPTGAAVCDPLGGGTVTGATKGLIGSLLYIPTAKQVPSTYVDFNSILASTVDAGVSLYMSQVNVPTRSWTEGFSYDGGNSYLMDSSGNKLVEYFALRMHTVLALPAGAPAGYYQLATVSDDGAAISLYSDNSLLAGELGKVHSTRADCGQVATYFDASTRLNVNVDYYQGPRTEIADVVMWRRVSDPTALSSSACGGGSLDAMKSAGFEIVPADAYNLPSNAAANPCAR